MSEPNHPPRSSQVVCAGAALVTLLAVQIIIGWEWLASGITKIVSGTFVSGLAANLKGNLDAAPHWYKGFLSGTVIPNAKVFAVVIEVGEIGAGVVLMVGGIVWLARWSRLSDRARMSLLGLSIVAALGAMFMAVNFHLANGANHPWLIPSDGFNETIDVDAMLFMIQGAYAVFCGYLLLKIRREYQPAKAAAEIHGALPAPS